MTAATSRYVAYGQVLASAVALPELLPAPPRSRVALTVSTRHDRFACCHETTPCEARSVAGEKAVWLRVLRGGSGTYELDFAGGAGFVLSADAARITVRSDCADPRVMRHLLIDQVVPLTLSHHGVSLTM